MFFWVITRVFTVYTWTSVKVRTQSGIKVTHTYIKSYTHAPKPCTKAMHQEVHTPMHQSHAPKPHTHQGHAPMHQAMHQSHVSMHKGHAPKPCIHAQRPCTKANAPMHKGRAAHSYTKLCTHVPNNAPMHQVIHPCTKSCTRTQKNKISRAQARKQQKLKATSTQTNKKAQGRKHANKQSSRPQARKQKKLKATTTQTKKAQHSTKHHVNVRRQAPSVTK